jgi:hypothetical protein
MRLLLDATSRRISHGANGAGRPPASWAREPNPAFWVHSVVGGIISRLRTSDRAIWSVLALLALGPLFLGIVAFAEQLH